MPLMYILVLSLEPILAADGISTFSLCSCHLQVLHDYGRTLMFIVLQSRLSVQLLVSLSPLTMVTSAPGARRARRVVAQLRVHLKRACQHAAGPTPIQVTESASHADTVNTVRVHPHRALLSDLSPPGL